MVNPSLRRNERLKTRLNRMFQTQKEEKTRGYSIRNTIDIYIVQYKREKTHTLNQEKTEKDIHSLGVRGMTIPPFSIKHFESETLQSHHSQSKHSTHETFHEW